MTNSKRLATFALAATCGGAFHVLAAETRPGVQTESELLTALDNSLWIADGKAAEKQIYLIAGPCCGHSQATYLHSRRLGGIVQLRRVEDAWPRDDEKCMEYFAEAAMDNSPRILVKMYETLASPGRVPQNIRENAVRSTAGLSFAIGDIIQKLDPKHTAGFRFPTAVWLSKEGVRVAVEPDRLEAIAQSVVARPEAAKVDPSSRRFLTAEYRFEPVPSKHFYAKSDGVKLFSHPDADSQLVAYLSKNRGFPGKRRVTVGQETWIELDWLQGVFVREVNVFPER